MSYDPYLKDEETGEYIHRKVYRIKYGSILPGYHVHHIDKNPRNNDIENLISIPEEFHVVLHEIDRAGQGIPRTKDEIKRGLSYYLKGKINFKTKRPVHFSNLKKPPKTQFKGHKKKNLSPQKLKTINQKYIMKREIAELHQKRIILRKAKDNENP